MHLSEFPEGGKGGFALKRFPLPLVDGYSPGHTCLEAAENGAPTTFSVREPARVFKIVATKTKSLPLRHRSFARLPLSPAKTTGVLRFGFPGATDLQFTRLSLGPHRIRSLHGEKQMKGRLR